MTDLPERPPGHAFRAHRVPVDDVTVVGVTDEGLGNTSWLFPADGAVVVVDPERDPLPYLSVAERLGAPVAFSLDTHLHADFVSGTRELATTGARAYASATAEVRWEHHAVRPGDRVELGDRRLEVLATPGHTPEHVAYLLADRRAPRAVFTGGALLVGGVARTDLVDPAATEDLTRELWRAIHRELLALPDEVLVLPTHGAGSFCSSAGGARRWTTIGEERRANPLLAAPDEAAFVRAVLDALGSYPPYFLRLRERNRLGPRVFGAPPALRPLDPQDVAARLEQGAVVVDVRPVDAYAAAHVAGSLADPLRPQFGSWLGWLVPDPETPLVFVTDEHTDRRELVRQCLNIGYEQIAGELDGGLPAWRRAGGEVASTPVVAVGELDGRRVIDVRQHAEFAAGHVPGAVNVELGALRRSLPSLPEEPLVLMCGHGERAASAASVLERAGRTHVAVLSGGPDDWARATGGLLLR